MNKKTGRLNTKNWSNNTEWEIWKSWFGEGFGDSHIEWDRIKEFATQVEQEATQAERKKVVTEIHTLFERCLYGKAKVEVGTPHNFESSRVNISAFDKGIEKIATQTEKV